MNKRTVKYEELNAKQKENFKNMVVELTYHNGISRDNLIALIKDMAQENAELKAELKAERDLQALIWTEKNNNEYYKAYVKDWQERKGKNATIPHADEVYKDYVELKARLEKSETTLFVVVRNNTPKLIEGEAAKMGFDKIAVRTIQKMEEMIDYPAATKTRIEAEKVLKEKGNG